MTIPTVQELSGQWRKQTDFKIQGAHCVYSDSHKWCWRKAWDLGKPRWETNSMWQIRAGFTEEVTLNLGFTLWVWVSQADKAKRSIWCDGTYLQSLRGKEECGEFKGRGCQRVWCPRVWLELRGTCKELSQGILIEPRPQWALYARLRLGPREPRESF